MTQSSYKTHSEQLTAMRAEAEAEAQVILKERRDCKRAEAEAEAQAILKERRDCKRAEAEAEAQAILKKRKNFEKRKNKFQGDNFNKTGEERVISQPKAKNKSLGCIGFLILFFFISWIIKSVKSCQEEREAETFYAASTTGVSSELSDDVDDAMAKDRAEVEMVQAEVKKRTAQVQAEVEKQTAQVQAEVEKRTAQVQAEVEKQTAQVQAEVEKQIVTASESSKDVKEILKSKFDYVYGLSHGFYKIEKNGKYGLANEQGQVVAAPIYNYIYPQDSKTGLTKVEIDGKYGFINMKTMKEVMKPKYTYIYPQDSKTGLTKVEIDRKYGFINMKTMKEVTPCIYTYIYNLDGGLYKVEIGDKTGYLNKDGSVLKNPE